MDIDFVLLWVDGSDPEWEETFKKYADDEDKEQTLRYRDWETLPYMFRSFETFTPWVRKIHFVTMGHLPKWLHIEHPKLHIVQHEDIIDKKYLPTFNSNAIEANLHKIEGLSEHFVLFNDDFFITSKIPKERFFQNSLPRDMLISYALSSPVGIGHFVLNNLEILNKHHDKKASIKRDFFKWFHPSYGKKMLQSLVLMRWPDFTGFIDPHQAQPFLKSTFIELWDKETKTLEQTSASKFRVCTDTNQYLFRYWQLIKGEFIPISMKDTCFTEITIEGIDSGKIDAIIRSQEYVMICLNDSEDIDDDTKFNTAKESVKHSFEMILPHKSDFER